MDGIPALQPGHIGQEELISWYRSVRGETERICARLKTDDYQLQSITETSPPKWHIAHVTWFFEAFVLPHFNPAYQPYHPRFSYLFNSYYETVGSMQPRPKRGMLSRPTVEEVYRYRAYVDEQMVALMAKPAAKLGEAQWQELVFRVTLGLNHEQQHQELLLMDIKHNLSVNPLRPAYREELQSSQGQTASLTWVERSGGVREIGYAGDSFAFDNETPRHEVLLQDHKLASRLVTNGEYLAFMADKGYQRPELWLADGWYLIQREGWRHPLYWETKSWETKNWETKSWELRGRELKDGDRAEDHWMQFTLGGLRELNHHEPVCHLSFYEADAYARWAGKRLPTEPELETMLMEQPQQGNFLDHDRLHPMPGKGQWYGDVWEWTASPYSPYPGFKPLAGSMGEYNGKFMCNQMVLRGGCCVTPPGHVRASYRNFFYPHDRWPFTGLRLAEDA
jgi:formylglycine-generating enzyme required for sulfatase activity